jgi:hypothetical protein
MRGAALSAPATQHLTRCAACRALADELSSSLASRGADDATRAELDALLYRVERAIAGENGRTARLRNLSTAQRLACVGMAAVAMTLAVALLTTRADIDVYPKERLLFSAAVFAALLAGLSWLHIRPLPRPPLSTRAIMLALGALALPWVIALLPEAHLVHAIIFRDAHDCLLLGTISGAALMTLLGVLDRSTSTSRSLLFPAAAGGALANLILTFHCPIVNPLHLAAIHAPIGVVLLFGSQGLRAARLRVARARGA